MEQNEINQRIDTPVSKQITAVVFINSSSKHISQSGLSWKKSILYFTSIQRKYVYFALLSR